MDCPECKLEFDETSHLPRILTACGHTICDSCLKSRYKKKNIICPQCSITTIAQSLNILPSNLALLQLKQKKIVQDVCNKHGKPIEAFCCNDKALVCVICLLEDGHKSHELTTIPKAAKKYRDLLSNYKQLSNSNLEYINRENKDLQEKQASLLMNYNKLLKDFLIIFEVIKKIISEKELQIKEKLKKTLDDEIDSINAKSSQLANFSISIETFKLEVLSSEKENDLDIILNFSKREELARSVTTKMQASLKTDPFGQFSIESEVTSLIKQIQNKFFQKIETKSTPTIKKKPLPGAAPINKKITAKPSGKTISKPGSALDWNNISVISRAHSDEDTLSMKSFDFNSLYKLHGTKIYAISGFSDKALSTVEVYDSNADNWAIANDCLNPRTQFAAINYINDIMTIGGKQGGKRISTIEKLNITTNIWSMCPFTLPTPKSGFAALSLSSIF